MLGFRYTNFGECLNILRCRAFPTSTPYIQFLVVLKGIISLFSKYIEYLLKRCYPSPTYRGWEIFTLFVKEELEPIKTEIKGLKKGQSSLKEQVQDLKTGQEEIKTMLGELDPKNATRHLELKDSIDQLRKDLSTVEIVTASNYSDIAKLKSAK